MTTDLPLWIYDSGEPTDVIEQGVRAARETLARLGVTAQAAHDADKVRASDEPHNAAAAAAWDDAERAALTAINARPAASLAPA